MKQIILPDYEAVSKASAGLFLQALLRDAPRVNIALPGGSAPLRLYELVADVVRDNPLLSHVHYYNLDEVEGGGISTNIAFLQEKYLERNKIAPERFHPLTEANVHTWEGELDAAGGMDFAVLGVGTDGHIAGIIPGTPLGSHTHLAKNTPLFRTLLAQAFGGEENVPEHVVTAGITTVLRTRKLLVMLTGAHKAEIVRAMIKGPVTADIPASVLQLHPDVTVIMDEAAASLL